ncbi:MAG TPA: NifU family protein [Acidobacteriota bacterium]|nr:NifU family protein [Acidobacteriota bacterium]
MSDTLQKVEDALETIRPALQADGGDIELVGVDEGVVTVRLMGACSGCPMAQMTLKQGVEARIRQLVPEIERVDSVPV